jgi:hypothetical protein
MSMSIEKKLLLTKWINTYFSKFSIVFCSKGAAINTAAILNGIKHVLEGTDSPECIYILYINDDSGRVPAYIGKSNEPVKRWRSHIMKLMEGKHSYNKWKSLILENEIAKFDCELLVVPDVAISEPPIKGFPKTIGSIEYQLVSLASDAFPDTLLNHEGNRR